MKRSSPIWSTLKNRQMTNLVSNIGDHLNAGRPSADHRNPLALKINRFVRPIEGMKRSPLEFIYPLEAGRRGNRKEADRHHDKTCSQLTTVADLKAPKILGLIEIRGFDLAVELHILSQVEFIHDEVQIAKVLRLT
jgi:hypothetical protein